MENEHDVPPRHYLYKLVSIYNLEDHHFQSPDFLVLFQNFQNPQRKMTIADLHQFLKRNASHNT